MKNYRSSERKTTRSWTLLDLSLLSIAIVSVPLNLSVFVQFGNNYQVFLGPSELHKTLLDRVQNLSTQLDKVNETIKQLQQTVVTRDAEISKLRSDLTQKDKEIERLRQVELRLVRVSGAIKAPDTPVEIIFKESAGEHRYKTSKLNEGFTYQASLENQKDYTVIFTYQQKILWVIPWGVAESKPESFRLTSDKPAIIKDFTVT